MTDFRGWLKDQNMNIKYIKEIGHHIQYKGFHILFSNKYCDLDQLKRKRFIELAGVKINVKGIAFCDQVHSDRFILVDAKDGGSGFEKPEISGFDALVACDENIIPMVKSADCTPVIIVDARNGCRAAIHSGREGTRKNIVGKTVLGMINNFGCRVEDLAAFIGPSIAVENYEVSEEIFNYFVKSTNIEQETFRKLDINRVIVKQLQKVGIDIGKIFEIQADTYANNDYHSFRRDQSKGRQISLVIKINKKNL